MDRKQAHALVDELFDEWGSNQDLPEVSEGSEEQQEKRKLPDGKRVVRTKSSGDRVYYLDEDAKTRQWITNPEVLKGLGFDMSDVTEVEDTELLGYQMAAALYRVPDATQA